MFNTFGQPQQQQQQQQQPSPFGSFGASSSTAPNQGAGTTLFGNQNTGAVPSNVNANVNSAVPGITLQPPNVTNTTPLFPSSTSNTASLFGGGTSFSINNANQNQNQNQNATSVPLGGTNASTTNGSGFGSTPFGQQPPQQQQQQQQQQQGQQQQPQTSSFGMFGRPGAPMSTAGPGLFGSTPASTSTFGTQPGATSGAFGSSTAPGGAAQSSNFGGGFGGAFGQGGTTALGGNGGTGAGMGTGLGGASSSFAPGPGPTSQPNAFGSSTLGASTLGASALGTPSGGPSIPADMNSIEGQLASIASAIMPGSPSNRFQYYFYNLVAPDQVHMFNARPPNATNEGLWIRANRENPNPSRLVPALAVGFEDLKKRADAQQLQVEGQAAAIRMLKQELEKLSTKHSMAILPLASRLMHAQSLLQSRLASLIHHLHLFIPALRGASLRPEEEVLRAKLEAIENEVVGRSGGGGLGRAGGRLAELWGVVGRVKAFKEAGGGAGGADGVGGWAVVDPAAFDEIKQILIEEQQGLKYLTDVLRTALRDAELVRTGFGSLDFASSTSGVP